MGLVSAHLPLASAARVFDSAKVLCFRGFRAWSVFGFAGVVCGIC